MGWKFDFSVVAMGDWDPGPDRVPHKSRYTRSSSLLIVYLAIAEVLPSCPLANVEEKKDDVFQLIYSGGRHMG